MKLLRIFTAGILALICMLSMTACSPGPISPSSMLTAGAPLSGDKSWSSSNFEITLAYPHTWYLSADQTAMAMFISPSEDQTPDFREYIAVGGETNPEGLSMEEIAQSAYEGVKAVFNKIELISTQETKVGQYDGLLYVFGGEADDEKLGPTGQYRWYQYTWLTGGASYSLTLTTSEEMCEEYLAVFNKVKDSLELA